MKPSRKMTLTMAAGAALIATPAFAEEVELSLADLMDLKVESVSKRSESLIAAPSAVYVLTAEDLRRYKVRRLQDALRLVPGVVQVDRNYYASNFNIREDLVEVPTTVSFQLDGIPIQNPVFGAVYFRGLDLPIEEIDRIEVIRGNGGTVYGANSVTGVVSIYTKHPKNSQGLAVSAAAGGPGMVQGALRYGGALALGQQSHWSAYGSMGYNKGYAADGNLYKGDSVTVPTPTGSARIANQFTSSEVDRPVTWNGMAQLETEWNSNLKTILRFYGRGMEDKAYARKAFTYPTLTQAQAQVAPTVIPTVLSKWVTNAADLTMASQYVATDNATALATLMIGKGYVSTTAAVQAVLPTYVTNAADLPEAVSYLSADDNAGLATFLVTKGYATASTAQSTVIALQTQIAGVAMKPVSDALTVGMTDAMTPLLSTAPKDSVWITDVHYRSFIGNLRTELSLSDGHHAFVNVNGTLNDYRYSEYELGVSSPNNWTLEVEAQDILDFKPFPWLGAEWITGGDMRYVKMNFGPSEPADAMVFEKPHASEWLRSAFVQGKLTFLEKVDLIAGLKGEQWTLVNDDIQWLPSARLDWRPMDNLTFWGSASRGTTVPGYAQTRLQAREVALPAYAPGVLPEASWGKWIATSSGQNPPKAVDYKDFEAGARWQNRTTMVDLSGYYMLANGRITTSFPDLEHPILSRLTGDSIVADYFTNTQDATLWGIEALVRNRPLPWLQGEISYAYHRSEITADFIDPERIGRSHKAPAHIVKARTSLDLPEGFVVSINGEYYSSYMFLQSSYDFANQRYDGIGSSATNLALQDNGSREQLIHLDANLAWNVPGTKLSVDIWGKNLAWWQWGYEAYDYQCTHPEKAKAMYGADVKWGF